MADLHVVGRYGVDLAGCAIRCQLASLAARLFEKTAAIIPAQDDPSYVKMLTI